MRRPRPLARTRSMPLRRGACMAVAWAAVVGCEIRDEVVEPPRVTADRLLRADALASGGMLGAAVGGPTAAPESIEYVESLPAAQARAAADGRPVLVVCRAAWCRWSTEIAQSTLADPKIVALSRGFVCVMLDADRHAEACASVGVTAFPTVIVLAADGSERSRTIGRPTTAALVAALEAGTAAAVASGAAATRR